MRFPRGIKGRFWHRQRGSSRRIPDGVGDDTDLQLEWDDYLRAMFAVYS